MMELLVETRIRPKNEITVPGIIRDMLNLNPGDHIRFEFSDGNIFICKAVTMKINQRHGGFGNGSGEA